MVGRHVVGWENATVHSYEFFLHFSIFSNKAVSSSHPTPILKYVVSNSLDVFTIRSKEVSPWRILCWVKQAKRDKCHMKSLHVESTEKNKLMNKMETEAVSCQSGGQGKWVKEVKGWAKEHTCMTHGHGQQCGDGRREGIGSWEEAGKRGLWTSAIVSTTKIK